MILDIDPKAKALIFDVDGTLADTMDTHYLAWQKTGELLNFVYPKEMFYELAGMPTRKITVILNERFGYNLDPKEVVANKGRFYIEMIDNIKIIEPVFDIVKKYHGKIPMSLGTGGKREFSSQTIKKLGLDKYFDIIVTADDVENHKPFPDTFLKCAELMDVKPSVCQVFEDGDKGLLAAISAGMIATDVRPYLV